MDNKNTDLNEFVNADQLKILENKEAYNEIKIFNQNCAKLGYIISFLNYLEKKVDEVESKQIKEEIIE